MTTDPPQRCPDCGHTLAYETCLGRTRMLCQVCEEPGYDPDVDIDDRSVLIATADRYWLRASITDEWTLLPEHAWANPEPGLEVIAAGTLEACLAAGRLLLESERP